MTSGIFQPGTRRDFVKTAAAGGVALALPTLLGSCKLGDGISTTTGGGLGTPLVFDFSKGDTAFLQFLYCYKQLEADLYAQAIAKFSTSGFTTAEQALLTEIHNHELVHRDTLKGILGAANDFTVSPLWSGTNFNDHASILSLAISFEDVSIGLHNGMPQHLLSATNIGILLELVSVEGRHSASLRDDDLPNTATFSPSSLDPSYAPSQVAGAIQPYLNDNLQFINAPTGI